jgi:Sulfotransferase family
MDEHQHAAAADSGRDGLRRVFLFGCPRSRTTVAQRVFSQALNLATMGSTNWFLEHASTRVLNGPAGSSRQQMRPFATERIRDHVRAVTGEDLPASFRLEEALDQLARATGAVGWLEKTPLHLLSIPEITAEIPGARFVHLVRDPAGTVTSLMRRAVTNPGMIGAGWQVDQAHDEHTWRTFIRATLAVHADPAHFVVDAEAFVDDPEPWARAVARFLELEYLPPEHPVRRAAQEAALPSHRPWKADAAGPVRRIHHPDRVDLAPLDAETVSLWAQAREVLGLRDR